MAVYIDDLYAPYGRMKMCHMIADTEEELHAMADKIGLKRKWYQGDHYDVGMGKRRLAVSNGTIQISIRELVLMRMKKREQDANTNGALTTL